MPCLFWVYTLLFAVSFFFCTMLVYPHWRPLSRPYGHQRLAAARSRRGSDMPPGMSFTTAPPLRYLKGAPRVRCSYCASAKPLPRSAAPSGVVQRRRGETVARSAEGVARVKHGAGNKRKCFPTINPHFAAISPYTFTSAGSSSTSGVSQPLYNKRSTLSPPRAAPRPRRRRPQKRCAPPRRPR